MLRVLCGLLFVISFASTGCKGTRHAPIDDPPASTSRLDGTDGGYSGHHLSYTRLLRRVSLSLLGRQPTSDEYSRVQRAPNDTAREAIINETVDGALTSVAFYQQMVDYAHDYLRVGSYNKGIFDSSYWITSQAIELRPCPTATRHAGILGVFNVEGYIGSGDLFSLCNDLSATITMVEPWWARGSTIPVIGRAGTGLRQHDGRDCGLAAPQIRGVYMLDDPNNPICSCGPNLIYCWPIDLAPHGDNYSEASQRRQAFEEPARFFAHLVWHDRPLTDLVLSNYTVAPLYLKYLYVRAGRMNSANAFMDDVQWWNPATWTEPQDPEHPNPRDPLAWHEIVTEKLNPHYLSLSDGASPSGSLDRTYRFDPRVDRGEPRGMPAAGVLTMMGSMSSFPRERVRAARWLETFACRSFVPPPADVQFNPYRRDPATEGVCQHCHRTIDPAAIHFKRWAFYSDSQMPILGGVGPWRMATLVSYVEPVTRWGLSFASNTIMTPVSDQQIEANPDARLIDFLPPDQNLFGATSDGTIGPLGFGKLLVQSGEFDLCAAQKLYERFVGRRLDPGQDQPLIQELRQRFVSGGRKVRPFVRYLMQSYDMRRGW